MRILDNFYENTERVLSIINSNFNGSGCGVGLKSPPLEQLDPLLYQQTKNKIFSLYNLPNHLRFTTYFTIYEYNPIEQLNQYCAHIDGRNNSQCDLGVEEFNLVLCGQVFLSESADENTGITFYEPRPELNWSRQELFDRALNNYLMPKNAYNAGRITLEQYTKLFSEYHDQFNTIDVAPNVFNRMVAWDAGTINSSRMTKKQGTKVVQNFYVEK